MNKKAKTKLDKAFMMIQEASKMINSVVSETEKAIENYPEIFNETDDLLNAREENTILGDIYIDIDMVNDRLYDFLNN